MGENVFEFIFTPVYWGGGGGGGEIFKFIFTPVCWGEKIKFNLFSLTFLGERKKISLPFVGERKYVQIYFHSRLLGRENIFRYIFTPVYWGEKIYLDIFFQPLEKEGKYI